MDPTLRGALEAVVGPGGVTDRAVIPADAAQVAGVLQACSFHGTRVAVVSGHPEDEPARGTVHLSLAAMAEVTVHAGAMVARAEAGAALSTLRAVLSAASMILAGSITAPSPLPTHVGSLIARGGLPRRALTGIEAVLTSGEVVRAGGLVQRDVAGYDLSSLLLGSTGRLAVITAVHLRLQPAGSRLEVHDAAGVVQAGSRGAALRAAFDPQGVLAG